MPGTMLSTLHESSCNDHVLELYAWIKEKIKIPEDGRMISL